MRENRIVQFVCFETTLNKEEFITQWEQFTSPISSKPHITLQQSEKKGLFKYIAQHFCNADEFEFVFARARRYSHNVAAAPIRTEKAGGYTMVQSEKRGDALEDESKIFVFLNNTQTDLDIYRRLNSYGKLNIYEAYFENCLYAYILEFFVKSEFTTELLLQLKKYDAAKIGIYKEFALEIS
jgi:hypothetical protein